MPWFPSLSGTALNRIQLRLPLGTAFLLLPSGTDGKLSRASLLLVQWYWGGYLSSKTSSAFISHWSSTPKEIHCILSVNSWGIPGKPSVPTRFTDPSLVVMSWYPHLKPKENYFYQAFLMNIPSACPAMNLHLNPSCHLVTHLLQKNLGLYEWVISSCAVLCWVTQSCPALWDSMDCSQPGSSVHEDIQARMLEWVAMPSSTCPPYIPHWHWPIRGPHRAKRSQVISASSPECQREIFSPSCTHPCSSTFKPTVSNAGKRASDTALSCPV